MVTDAFDDGAECRGVVSAWRGTRVPPSLESRLGTATAAVTVEQVVRLRTFERGSGRARRTT